VCVSVCGGCVYMCVWGCVCVCVCMCTGVSVCVSQIVIAPDEKIENAQK
jgi:hypothetical protein